MNSCSSRMLQQWPAVCRHLLFKSREPGPEDVWVLCGEWNGGAVSLRCSKFGLRSIRSSPSVDNAQRSKVQSPASFVRSNRRFEGNRNTFVRTRAQVTARLGDQSKSARLGVSLVHQRHARALDCPF